jgi:hypothetical protein
MIKVEDTKGVISKHQSKKDRQWNGPRKKTLHRNYRLGNTNTTRNGVNADVPEK